MNQQHITSSIAQASKVIGKTWPLYSFVTSNPLTGYEQTPFLEAVQQAQQLLNAQVFPDAAVYRIAFTNGLIDSKKLTAKLTAHGFNESPEYYLNVLDRTVGTLVENENHKLDNIMAKWLAAFMDEGLAEWEMPYKHLGFYGAWRTLARYDKTLGIDDAGSLPATSLEAIAHVMQNYDMQDYERIFTFHLAALPGWTGYINHRQESGTDWQAQYPVSLVDYLAIRLTVAKHIDATIVPQNVNATLSEHLKLQYLWLQAWEQSWQDSILKKLQTTARNAQPTTTVADAQLVFCIDTRSELIRRHVEASGNYETYGYAGFFGIAMDYKNLDDGIVRKSCPPIVGSAYTITETAQDSKHNELEKYKEHNTAVGFQKYFLTRMKNMLPSAFGFVEGAGLYYGVSLFTRTLAPGRSYRRRNKESASHEHFCQPEMNPAARPDAGSASIALEEKVGIVKGAFDLMGWKTFAPIVVFAGHGSHSANNPFGSSLDCGACAASPGRHNARMLASLANLTEVRDVLRNEHNINIPDGTVFVGAEHNTTTDQITLFDNAVPATHTTMLQALKTDLSLAQVTATQDRLAVVDDSVSLAQYKAGNWSETRPEWGLAKNAGFIVGPRTLTQNENLNSRCFLHSYDWEQDITGQALEGIIQGPMVVTQWINNHYYFTTVDNNKFGGGSKITHNITGRYGVVQGNGGDLKMGLPLQSLQDTDTSMYHEPLRLSVVIQAPLARVIDILERNAHLQTLLDNEWIYLVVMDPRDDFKMRTYEKGLSWRVYDFTHPASSKVSASTMAAVPSFA